MLHGGAIALTLFRKTVGVVNKAPDVIESDVLAHVVEVVDTSFGNGLDRARGEHLGLGLKDGHAVQ